MRKVMFIAAILILMSAVACGTFWSGGSAALQALKGFLTTADNNITYACNEGWIAANACMKWQELYAEAGAELEHAQLLWSDLSTNWKTKILEFIISFLSDKFVGAESPLAFYTDSDQQPLTHDRAMEIVSAAEGAHLEGWLSYDEIKSIRAAAEQ